MFVNFLKRRSSLFVANTFISMMLLLTVSSAIAQPGNLDTNFGGGLVTMCSGLGIAVTTQPNGKILVTGRADNSDDDLVVVRYLPSGMRDASFGLQGVATWDGGYDDLGRGIAVQPDGRIVVVGTTGNGLDDDMMVMRFNADGSIDNSFGIAGVVIINASSLDEGHAVALQPDGRIVAVGRSFTGGSNNFLIVRLNFDGTPDSSFNGIGVQLWDNGGNLESASGLALQPDGRMVVVGYSQSAGNDDLAVVRFNENGTLDNSFGNGGALLWDGMGEARGAGVALQADGRIVVVGEREMSGNVDLLVLRLTGDGFLDTNFGILGAAIWDGGGEDQGTDARVEDNGRIVVSGFTNNGSDNDALLLGFDDTGDLDSGFATGGAFIWNGGNSDLFHGLSLQPEGKILGVGGTFANANWNLVLMRFHGGSALTGIIPNITVSSGNPFILTGQLNTGSMSGQNADWWVGVNIASSPPDDWYHYDLTSGWMPGKTPTYQGPLFDLSPYDISGMSGLPVGTYTFYLAVDMDMNGLLDMDQIYYDSVQVNITQ